jgi:hypothetical protein
MFDKIFYFLSIISLMYLYSCTSQSVGFPEMDEKEFQSRWEKAQYSSAISFWCLGEKQEYYYFIEKRLITSTQDQYKISKKYIKLNINFPNPKGELLTNQTMINLKQGDVVFLINKTKQSRGSE